MLQNASLFGDLFAVPDSFHRKLFELNEVNAPTSRLNA